MDLDERIVIDPNIRSGKPCIKGTRITVYCRGPIRPARTPPCTTTSSTGGWISTTATAAVRSATSVSTNAAASCWRPSRAATRRREQRNLIRWLRPEFQNPDGQQAEQTGIAVEAAVTVAARDKRPWPKTLPDQVQALRGVLGGQPLTAEQLAARFKGARRERVEEPLQTLAMLGQVRAEGAETYIRG